MDDIRILAVDPGSKNLGWSHMLNDHIVMCGTLKLNGNHPDTYTRLYYFINMQLDGIQASGSIIRMVPQYIILESFFTGNMRGTTVIPELRGVIKLAAYQRNIEVIDVAPQTVKKCVTGKGNADKNMVRRAINEKYGMSTSSEDEADSVAIGLTGLNILRSRNVNNNI
jgi:Holliday junction resolvasome RuvABC endonuclease subunit